MARKGRLSTKTASLVTSGKVGGCFMVAILRDFARQARGLWC